MNGIFCIDKPAGLTSFDVVARIRRLFGEKKVGHTGTLDPMATGVLPLLLGRATRAAELLPSHDKAYEASFRPGVTTDTGDITGRVLSSTAPDFTYAQLEQAVQACRGEQLQTPPMYSAVKVDGRRLYELARQGRVVERAPRPVTVYEIALLAGPDENGDCHIAVRCSKGTYIRTLCEKIGGLLGCGAAMTALRRTMAAGFMLADCLTLAQAEELAHEGMLGEHILPLETAFAAWPVIEVTAAQGARFENGGGLAFERLGGPVPAGPCRVYANGAFAGLARPDPQAGELKVLLNRVSFS